MTTYRAEHTGRMWELRRVGDDHLIAITDLPTRDWPAVRAWLVDVFAQRGEAGMVLDHTDHDATGLIAFAYTGRPTNILLGGGRPPA